MPRCSRATRLSSSLSEFAACSPSCVSRPLTACATCVSSVDGHPLPIDELKGTKPIERLDLSGKSLRVASAIIIASCIKDNPVLKHLMCFARHSPQHPSTLTLSVACALVAALTTTNSAAKAPTPRAASPTSARTFVNLWIRAPTWSMASMRCARPSRAVPSHRSGASARLSHPTVIAA